MKKTTIFGLVALLIAVLSACEAPDHTQVRRGLDPENQDTDVRFRTTYYFRVFDACAVQAQNNQTPGFGTNAPFVQAPSQGARIITDSLYRFRMTGKANALANKIRFESGTLRKEEIDPFGATVAVDKKTGQPRFQSRAETEALARRADAERNLEKLLRLYGGIEDQIGGPDGKSNADAVKAMRDTIQKQIQGELAAMVATAPNQPPAAGNGGGNVFARLSDSSKIHVAEIEKLATSMETNAKAANAALGKATPDQAEAKKQLETFAKLLASFQANKGFGHTVLRNLATTVRSDTDPFVIAELAKLAKDPDDTEKPAGEISSSLKFVGAPKAEFTVTQAPTAGQTVTIDRTVYEFVAPGVAPASGNLAVPINTDVNVATASLLKEIKANQPRNPLGYYVTYEQIVQPSAKFWGIVVEETAGASAGIKPLPFTATSNLITPDPANSAGGPNTVSFVKPQGPPLTDHDLSKLQIGATAAKKVGDAAIVIATAARNAFGTLDRDLQRQLSANGSKLCGGDQQRRRGFQVLGPEGWKTFDQDERLIMAMTSSAKPLIGSLTKVSSQVLKQEASRNDQLLPLVEEQLRISEAQRAVLGTDPLALKSETIEELRMILGGEQ